MDLLGRGGVGGDRDIGGGWSGLGAKAKKCDDDGLVVAKKVRTGAVVQ